MVGDYKKGAHNRGISGSASLSARSANSGSLVGGNGEPAIFYHGTKDTIRLEDVNNNS